MPDIQAAIYIPIALALVAVIGILWKKVDEYSRLLITDSNSWEAVLVLLKAADARDQERDVRDQKIAEALALAHKRLESLHKKVDSHVRSHD